MSYARPETRRAYTAKLRKRRNENGICQMCTRPRTIGRRGKLSVLCAVHLDQRLIQSKAKWRRVHGPRDFSKLLSMDHFAALAPVDLSYAAALIEGEGHIWVGNMGNGKRGLYPKVIVRMVDPEPIQFMHTLFGGCFNSCTPKYDFCDHCRLTYSWEASGRLAGAVCKAILPYLKMERKRGWALFTVKVGDLAKRYSFFDIRDNPQLTELVASLQAELTVLRETHANL